MSEHPGKEHPESGPEEEEERLNNLADVIEDFVKNDSKTKGGYFLVYDQVAKKPLALTLDKVHKDKLSRVSEDKYFACADFMSIEGKMYDLDMFVRQGDEGLKVAEVDIHKEAGKPRYQWVEERGIWKKA